MIAPITNFAITGALWYQGESNAGTAYMYTKLLSALIESWRKKWSIEFPFYFVQIAPYNYGNNLNGPLLREAQSRVKLEKTGMVVISDLVDNVNDIHPQNKLDVAIRLADMALAEHYKVKSGPYKYPRFKEMKIEKNRVRIYFENAEAGLMSRNGEVMDFTIAGEDKVFHKAIAKIEGNTVVLYSPAVSQPVAVRFGFENRSMPNLFSKEGLPVNLFRTDNWLIGQLSN
jgi:sialate O-acetylesterase